MYALQLNNISKSYQDGDETHVVLDGVSLQVKPGEFVAIVGPSGSGKSTFLSIAGALLAPTQGECIVGNQRVDEKNKKEWTKIRRDNIGFIFQTHQLIPYLTVKEQLELVKKLGKKTSGLTYNECIDLLNDLGLGKSIDKYPNQLSGGERQRVAIARAFANQPQLILADEPTASLDGTRGHQVVEMIQQQVKKQNKAAVMVTHDERVLDLVDTIYHIEDGKLTKVK